VMCGGGCRNAIKVDVVGKDGVHLLGGIFTPGLGMMENVFALKDGKDFVMTLVEVRGLGRGLDPSDSDRPRA